MSKTWAEWLDEFTRHINEGYESHRIDRIVSGHAYEQEEPQRRILHYSTPMRGGVQVGEVLNFTNVTFREVPLYNVGVHIDMEKWSTEPSRWGGMDHFMWSVGARVAERQYGSIFKSLCDYVGTNFDSEHVEKLTNNDLRRARDHLDSLGIFGDTFIVSYKYLENFRARNEIWNSWDVPTGYVPEELRGRFFVGIISVLRTYRKYFLDDKAVIFRRDDIMSYTTLLNVSFDREPPTKLIIEKWCSSAPIVDESVVVINIKKE